MCTAAVSGLSTVALMGYSLSIPDYFEDIFVFVLFIVFFISFVVRLLYVFLRKSSAPADDDKK